MLGVACGPSSDEAAAPVESAAAIDPAKARAFLAYQEKLIGFVQRFRKDGENPGTTAGMRAWNDLEAALGESAEALDEAREELGLSEYEVASLSEIEAGIFVRGAGQGLVLQIAELEKTLEDLPPAQRAEAEKSLEEMREMKASIVDMKEARAKYGDAAVDAMLALESELSVQYQELLGAP